MRLERRVLGEAELAAALVELPGWRIEGGKLHRELRFADFAAAWGFMSAAALVSERLDHHPEWFNVYATVRVDLTTHDCGGISPYDLEWARRVERFVGGAAPSVG
ncbi:MAG: 4a-hydroxytetrahydrobiopterin dehydratase [Acidimicrobiales bacterium]